jgi:hypothetical protein
MPKVICKLENAAAEISGVKFDVQDDGTRVSEDISAEAAELFTSIPGYELLNEAPKAPVKPVKKAVEKSAEKPVEPDAPVAAADPTVAADPDESIF